jgi:hypothetical protein
LRKRRGGKEQRRKGVEDRNKTVYFLSGIAVLCLKCNPGIGKPVGQNKAFILIRI